MASVVDQRRGLWRSRWAAIGAVVAVTLGGGGMVAVNAASSAPSSIVTIDPVRILDTRTDVGLPGPFVSAVSQKLQVTGAAVPAGATGVLLNVTAVGPTANGFVSVRPGDAVGAPTTSSLNFNAGSVVPNSVQVGLPTVGANAGKIDITYDAYGVAGPTTEVLIDVVGYTVAGGAGTGPAGPAGPAGAIGPAGATGAVGPAGPPPADLVRGSANVSTTCTAVLLPAVGKAIVLTSVHVNVFANTTPGFANNVILHVGTTCNGLVDVVNPGGIGVTSLDYGYGLVIPANSGLYATRQGNVSAEVYANGYQVPASQVLAAQVPAAPVESPNPESSEPSNTGP